MHERIVGICRFSFLGKDDWIGTRRPAQAVGDRILSRIPMLYAPGRMDLRMHSFEQMLLPSIRAQTDPDFDLWILTSPELPDQWLERLDMLCAEIPQITILMSEERSVEDALRAPLIQAAEESGRSVLQFRIDDDDALSRHFIARLRANARRFDDLPEFAFSQANGFVISSYDGRPVAYSRKQMRFTGAGVALRLATPGRSIFSMWHFNIPRTIPAFSNIELPGYVVLRWDVGDSAPERKWDVTEPDNVLTHEAFLQEARDDFPFLMETDFSFMVRPDSG